MALAYTPPNLCIGTYTLQNDCTDKADNNTLENYIAENIEIAGAKINVFMLRGVHAQGKLMDLGSQDFVMNFSTDANKRGLAGVATKIFSIFL